MFTIAVLAAVLVILAVGVGLLMWRRHAEEEQRQDAALREAVEREARRIEEIRRRQKEQPISPPPLNGKDVTIDFVLDGLRHPTLGTLLCTWRWEGSNFEATLLTTGHEWPTLFGSLQPTKMQLMMMAGRGPASSVVVMVDVYDKTWSLVSAGHSERVMLMLHARVSERHFLPGELSVKIEQTVNDARDPDRIRLTLDAIADHASSVGNVQH